MSNIAFYTPRLKDNGAWLDYRSQYPGGYGWRYDRALTKIKYAANHHSVTQPSGNAKKDVDQLWAIHKGNGWGGIGYNFVITSEEITGKDGLRYAKVAYVGDIGSVRAHTPNTKGAGGLKAGYGNEDIVAACMIGMLHQKNPTDAQIRSAYWLYRELITQEKSRMPNLYGSLNAKLQAHQTFDPTACPGNWAWQKDKIVKYTDPPKIEKKLETRVATIPFTEKTVEDNTVLKGETRVIQEGADGEKQVIWEVTYTNGKETSRKIKSEKITQKPTEKITAIGTFVPPEPPVITPEPGEPIQSWLERLVKWVIEILRKFTYKK